MSWSSTFFAGCGSAALTGSTSVTLSLVINASSLIRSYTDRFTSPELDNIQKGAIGDDNVVFDAVGSIPATSADPGICSLNDGGL